MNIVCSIDNNYVQHCAVMLTSLFENNKDVQCNIYILSEGLLDNYIIELNKLVANYGSIMHYHQINSDLLKDFPIHEKDHLSIATYYRLLIPSILPKDELKAIYLDSDIIINYSLDELWNTDISNYALAAVDEMGCSKPDVFSRLQIDESYGYFNAGVLLINLEYWRKFDIMQQCFDYINNHSDKVVSHDQDILNAILFDKWKKISCIWNMIDGFLLYKPAFISEENYKYLSKHVKKARIVHYTCQPKPWEQKCLNPYRNKYIQYMNITNLSNISYKKNNLIQTLKYSIIHILIKTKLAKPIYSI